MKPRTESNTVLFDVFYDDGSRASNRKVPAAVVAGLDGDDAAMTFIMDQERKIAELSGKAPSRSSAWSAPPAKADRGRLPDNRVLQDVVVDADALGVGRPRLQPLVPGIDVRERRAVDIHGVPAIE